MTTRSLYEMLADMEVREAARPWCTGFWNVWHGTKHAPQRAWREVHYAWQRVFRGWDDRALWNLDVTLCRTLGAQLQALANTTHRYPMSPTQHHGPDIWVGMLHSQGRVLAEYAEFTFTAGHLALSADARAALRWVADNLSDLWD